MSFPHLSLLLGSRSIGPTVYYHLFYLWVRIKLLLKQSRGVNRAAFSDVWARFCEPVG